MLKIDHLTKAYPRGPFFKREKNLVVNDLCLEVYQGEIVGFLGPNGAGKTTTMNMVTGIIRPTGGQIELFGSPFEIGQTQPLYRIGYVPETTLFPGYFSVTELLDFYAQIFHISKIRRRERIKYLLDLVGLYPLRHVLLRKISIGQRRLVDFMQALVNEPDLILLDEPTVYLDPIIIERVRKILIGLKEEGKTIFISSHVLLEIEKLSDRVAIINKGKLLKIVPKQDFTGAHTMEEVFFNAISHEDA